MRLSLRHAAAAGLCAALLVLAVPSAERASAGDREYQIGWSVWTGWMPFKIMGAKGFLEKRARAHGVRARLVEFKGYMDSVQAFSARKLDGCAMTSMEALQPAA